MISLNWTGDYVDIKDESVSELTDKITKFGVNIEAIIRNNINNLVVGHVLKVEPHPDSDHLNVCQVDIGEVTTQIVCGASNVRENLKVIVALPGAILPGGFEIKKSKIRGIESNGMICALFELGLEEKTEEAYNKGITELNDDAKVGVDALKYLGFDDTILELDIHKHHNNDCYYHIGFAYIVAAILNKKVKLPSIDIKEDTDSINNHFSLSVDTKKCPFYTARMVKGVKVGESPDFIKKRLEAVGMRSINNVVDISNYVMLEYGQPLHFFDKDKLGCKVVVRNAFDNEVITTLDGKERILTCDDIVITDGNRPVCIAGVMGGENTEVDESTTNILIESAIFDAISIRKTSSRLDLRSEASIRYGKGLNYEYTIDAINRACYLLQEYASGTVLKDTIMHDTLDKTPKIIKVKSSDINDILGISITDDDMRLELDRLDFEYKYDKGLFTITVPNRRLDIECNAADIAEEIGCLYGYHNLVGRKDVSKRLRALGFDEDKNYTLVSVDEANLFRYEDKKQISLPNPMSMDKSVIRTTLIPSLINTYLYNKKRKVKDINIYEIANTYDSNYIEDTKICILASGDFVTNSWQGNTKVDFYLVKGVLENLLDYLGLKNRYDYLVESIPDMHPGVSARVLVDREEVGIIGRVHPKVNKDEIYVIELSLTKLCNKKIKPIKFKESSKYPSIVKDVAFVVNKDITNKEITDVIKKAGARLLDNIEVFDVYTGDNVGKDEKSIAYSLTFKDDSRTLNEDEVMQVFNKIIEAVETKLKARVRDK